MRKNRPAALILNVCVKLRFAPVRFVSVDQSVAGSSGADWMTYDFPVCAKNESSRVDALGCRVVNESPRSSGVRMITGVSVEEKYNVSGGEKSTVRGDAWLKLRSDHWNSVEA